MNSKNVASSSYRVPAESIEVETEVKKSRFIALAAKASSREEALLFLDNAKKDYPDARHHCWAYLLGNPFSAASAAMNDDGEPSGSAGKPILNVIQHKKIGDIVVVVIRYFGGVKLGAGGLVRAYSGATESALSQLVLQECLSKKLVSVKLNFSQEQLMRHWAEKFEADVMEVNYSSEVVMKLNVADDAVSEMESFCRAHSITYSV